MQWVRNAPGELGDTELIFSCWNLFFFCQWQVSISSSTDHIHSFSLQLFLEDWYFKSLLSVREMMRTSHLSGLLCLLLATFLTSESGASEVMKFRNISILTPPPVRLRRLSPRERPLRTRWSRMISWRNLELLAMDPKEWSAPSSPLTREGMF